LFVGLYLSYFEFKIKKITNATAIILVASTTL